MQSSKPRLGDGKHDRRSTDTRSGDRDVRSRLRLRAQSFGSSFESI
jgi:hypothetical protein